jgi:hypothetical protein
MARGGNRTPRQPAAVSGPGALSQRTDGGAGQPIRAASNQPYGARQATETQQAAAPLASGGGGAAPRSTGTVGANGSPLPPIDAFGPTQRPNEPMTAGLGQEGLYSPDDPDLPIRIMYQLYPHPSLARLLES